MLKLLLPLADGEHDHVTKEEDMALLVLALGSLVEVQIALLLKITVGRHQSLESVSHCGSPKEGNVHQCLRSVTGDR